MILPIIAYGDPILRKVANEIDKDFPNLNELIENMKSTMENASGVGLAAPQVGKSIRLFMVNTTPFSEDEELTDEERAFLADFNKIFINAKILKYEGELWPFSEGCLSVPDIREEVFREETITIEYVDENFEPHIEKLSGIASRVVQHEYDHTEGILFTDKVSSLKKRLLKKKLENITKGKVNPDYKMKFPLLKKRS